MPFTLTQVVLLVFLFFAISRVFLRFKGGILSTVGFFFWSGLFGIAIIAVLAPGLTSKIAQAVGIGRGVDAVVYSSIVLLFYLIFRLHVFIEDIKHDITTLVKKLALKELEEQNVKKPSKN